MQEHIWVKPLRNTGIDVYQFGKENCAPQHSYGPAVRDHYLVHFVLQGCGTFSQNHVTYPLKAGQGFLICPDQIAYYEASADAPWTYLWVGFQGEAAPQILKSLSLGTDAPVFSFTNAEQLLSTFDAMKRVEKLTVSGQLQLTGYLYLLLSCAQGGGGQAVRSVGSLYAAKREYVKRAIAYIQKNFARKIHVEEIAASIGLNRSYFGALFKEYTGLSPQEFIIRFRMQKAEELLKNPALSIGDAARSVGYDDPLLFSKIFKKVHGMPPSTYRML